MKLLQYKKAVIREELKALTGCYMESLILNQFLYWTKRVNDFDDLLMEEQGRIDRYRRSGDNIKQEPISLLLNGWIYKSASQLNDEIMVDCTDATILKFIDRLCKKGYLQKRRNPRNPWERTWQYRVDLFKVMKDLDEIGYKLSEYDKVLFVDDDVDPVVAQEPKVLEWNEVRSVRKKGRR